MKFNVIMLLSCILYSKRRARLHLELFASALGRSRFLSRMSYFVLVYFSSGDNVALLSESDTFVDLIKLMLLYSMYRFFLPVVVLAPHDSNVVIYAHVC